MVEPIQEENNNSFNKLDILKYGLIFFGVVDVLPLAIGLPLMFALQNPIYLEVTYIIFGVFALLAWLFRMRRRDSRNYKTNKSVFEQDKTNADYKMYRATQWLMFGAGILALVLAYVSFLIGQNITF